MAPKAEKKPAKKVAKSTSSAAAKKRKLAKAETYKIYIYKVLKQVRLRRPQVLWKRLHLGALT
jgi:histone H2B